MDSVSEVARRGVLFFVRVLEIFNDFYFGLSLEAYFEYHSLVRKIILVSKGLVAILPEIALK